MRFSSDQLLLFVNSQGTKFKLTQGVIVQMKCYVQNATDKKEAGGVLLGRYILDCLDVVVDRITVPMREDSRGRFRFLRSALSHQQVIFQAWRRSQGTCNYLGEWHTHPEPNPSPSAIDLRTWQRKLSKDRYDSDVLYFVIVGTKQINVWQGERHTLKIEKLDFLDQM
jgi:integrative and conjugative element protein (TIGR02256 family)